MSDNTRQYLILDQLNNLTTETLVGMWNDWASNHGASEDYIEEFYEDFINNAFDTPMDAIRAVCHGDVTYSDDYIRFNAYGNLVSFNFIDDENSPYDAETLATWLDDNDLGDYADEFSFDEDNGD